MHVQPMGAPASRSIEDEIYRVRDEGDEVYDAPTKVGPITRDQIAELMRATDEDAPPTSAVRRVAGTAPARPARPTPSVPPVVIAPSSSSAPSSAPSAPPAALAPSAPTTSTPAPKPDVHVQMTMTPLTFAFPGVSSYSQTGRPGSFDRGAAAVAVVTVAVFAVLAIAAVFVLFG
jgi:hypothetical protein